MLYRYPIFRSLNSMAKIPIVDLSLLTAGTPDERSEAIQLMGHACREWGLFMATNHGMPTKLMDEMLNVGKAFNDLADEEKQKYVGKQGFDSLRQGKHGHREYTKFHVYPDFHAPQEPAEFGETVKEYCTRTRELAGELLKGISNSLGLKESYLEEKLDMRPGFQLYDMNYYPPRPRPDVATGLGQHTDFGVLTLLIQDRPGLQILYNGEWLPINPPPYSFIIHVADQLQVLTNGLFKSVMHRAVLDEKETRISVVSSHGPSLDTIVSPASEFVDGESHPPRYCAMNYRDYMELKCSPKLRDKCALDYIRL